MRRTEVQGKWAGWPIVAAPFPADHPTVCDAQFHPIDDYLSEGWLDQWASQGVAEIELYLTTYPAPTDLTDAEPA
jgi:hypothetical protein